MAHKSLKRPIICICLLLLALISKSFALDGCFVGRDLVIPSYNTQISLIKARVTIESNRDDWDIQCTEIYQNTGGKATVAGFGFPTMFSSEEGGDRISLVRDFKTLLDGSRVKTVLKKSMESTKVKGMKYPSVYAFNVNFQPKAKRTIKHSFSIAKDETSSGYTFLKYALLPGSLWKGEVQSLEVSLGNIDQRFICLISPPGYALGENSISWEFLYSEPAGSIRVIWDSASEKWIKKIEAMQGQVLNQQVIEGCLTEGESAIKRCFFLKDPHGYYDRIRQKEDLKTFMIDSYKKLVDWHPKKDDLTEMLPFSEFLCLLAGDKKGITEMYCEYLKIVKTGKSSVPVEDMERVAEKSRDYLKDYRLATDIYGQMLITYRNSAPPEKIAGLLAEFAKCYIYRGEYAKAIDVYRKILIFAGKNIPGKYGDAVEYTVAKLLELNENITRMDDDIRLKLNRAVFDLSKKHTGIRQYEVMSLAATASIYERQGRFSAAIKIYNRILATYPQASWWDTVEIEERLKAAKVKTRTEKVPPSTGIVNGLLLGVFMFAGLFFGPRLKKMYGLMVRLYQWLDDRLYRLFANFLPLVRTMGSNISPAVEKIIEDVSDRTPDSVKRITGKIKNALVAVLKVIAGDMRWAVSRLKPTMDKLMPAPIQKKISDRMRKIFSVFAKKEKEKIVVSGEITKNHLWKDKILITGDIIIKEGVTLSIKAGTAIIFAGSSDNDVEVKDEETCISNPGTCDIVVYGKLIVQGKKNKPVIIGSANWGSIVFLKNAKDSVIDFCEITGAVSAIKCCGTSSPRITNSLISKSTGYAVEIRNGSSAYLENNRMSENAGGGMLCCNSSGAHINSNTITNNGNVGIKCMDSSTPRISKNTISEEKMTGIECIDKSDCWITGNTIEKNGKIGVLCNDASTPKIKGNNIWHNETGIDCRKSAVPAIGNNHLKRNEVAILCNDETNVSLTGNTVANNKTGIRIGTSVNLDIASNEIHHNAMTGIECHSFAKHTVRENNIYGNGTGMTCFDASSPLVREDQFKENRTGIVCEHSSAPMIEDSGFLDNSDGIVCNASSKPRIKNCRFEKNKVSGLKCFGTSAPELEFNTFEKNNVAVCVVKTANPRMDPSNIYKDNERKTEELEQKEENKEAASQPVEGQTRGPMQGIKDIPGIILFRENAETMVVIALEEALKWDMVNEKVSAESIPNLDKIAELFKNYQDMDVEINCHTDNTGNPGYNQQLTENLSNSILEYFVKEKGLAGSRFRAYGFGGTKPAGSNETEEGRRRNRRTEFKLIKKPPTV